MLNLIGNFIGGLFGIGSQYLNNKKEKAQAKHERELTEIKEVASWDQIQASNSNNSWKDEYLTILFTLPLIVMFTAAALGYNDVVENIKYAFIVLKTEVPEEYWYILSAIVAASFGVKNIIKGIKELRTSK